MKKTITFLIISLNILCYSQFSGGLGTIEDPYQVATAENLDNIRNYLTSNFIQTADIDLGVSPWNEGEGWQPIGTYEPSDPSKSFRGNYDGDVYKIENMFINIQDRSAIGLFGSTNGCILKNIQLNNIDIKSIALVGGLSGISYNDNIISCKVSGTIQGNDRVGLLTGFFEGYNIKNCHTNGSISTTNEGWMIGGLIGLCTSDSVYNCSSNIALSDTLFEAGGLIGSSFSTKFIEDCYTMCSINASHGGTIGGLIGYTNAFNHDFILNNSFSDGEIISNSNFVGGLIGGIQSIRIETTVSLNNSYSKTNVQGIKSIGGIIGRVDMYTTIENCYSTGQVTGNSDVGGLIGKIDSINTVTVTNSYWDMETSGIDSSAAGEGRTTAEMTLPYSGSIYIDWDFTDVWADDIYFYNEGYPRLFWTTDIMENGEWKIENCTLYQNYPNPFNPVTQIKFALPEAGSVKLNVYNINGQLVSELVNGAKQAGIHTVSFDGSKLNSGMYFYMLEANDKRMIKKMIMTK